MRGAARPTSGDAARPAPSAERRTTPPPVRPVTSRRRTWSGRTTTAASQQQSSVVAGNAFAAVYWSTLLAGTCALLLAATQLDASTLRAMSPAVWLLTLIAMLAETRPVIATRAYNHGEVTAAPAFAFAILFLYGAPAAIASFALVALVAGLFRRRPLWRLALSVARNAVAMGVAGVALIAAGWPLLTTAPHTFVAADIAGMVLAWSAYFLITTGINAYVDSRRHGTPFADVFYEDFGYRVFCNVAVLVFSPVVALVTATSLWWLPLILPPMAAIYAATSLALAREHQANHDALTSLPNRSLLRLELQRALDHLDDAGTVALLVLDLDRFKEVNDTLGHRTGDQLLQLVSERLSDAVRPQDMVARLGGDEFAILLPEVRDGQVAVEIAHRLRTALDEPFELEGMLLEPEASIGVALAPDHGHDVEQLLRCADIAMYLAKEERSGVETYAADRDRHSTSRLGMLGALRRAIDCGELELFYQPKLSLRTSAVTGVEALVRWRHPQRGLVLPDEFVPLAESSGLMQHLTACVVDQALAQAAEWWSRGMRVPVAVNVSARDLHGPHLAETVAAGLRRHNLDARAIRLELTERVLMSEPARVADCLAALDQLGVSLSLDDFGTGYSSLVLLQRLPVSEIKVDRSFVHSLAASAENATIVRSIVDLAHGLGIEAVAEGVENDSTWKRLAALGCDSAQGWYVARPMSSVNATEWLARHYGKRPLHVVAGA